MSGKRILALGFGVASLCGLALLAIASAPDSQPYHVAAPQGFQSPQPSKVRPPFKLSDGSLPLPIRNRYRLFGATDDDRTSPPCLITIAPNTKRIFEPGPDRFDLVRGYEIHADPSDPHYNRSQALGPGDTIYVDLFPDLQFTLEIDRIENQEFTLEIARRDMSQPDPKPDIIRTKLIEGHTMDGRFSHVLFQCSPGHLSLNVYHCGMIAYSDGRIIVTQHEPPVMRCLTGSTRTSPWDNFLSWLRR